MTAKAKPKPKKKTIKQAPPRLERALKSMDTTFNYKVKSIKGLEKELAKFKKGLATVAKLVRAGKYEDAFSMLDSDMIGELNYESVYLDLYDVTGDLYNELDDLLSRIDMEKEDAIFAEQKKAKELAYRDKYCHNCGVDLR
jgi:hypothetical protein